MKNNSYMPDNDVVDDMIDEFTYKSAVMFFVWGFFIFFIVTVLLVVFLHYGPKAI